MQKVEGIILKTSSFEESAHILHVLSKEFGLVSLVAKAYSSKLQRSYSPLLKIEAVVVQSEKELWKCKELVITQSYPSLRMSLDAIRLATHLIQEIYQIIPRRYAVETIYTLLDEHLSAFSTACSPYIIASSFLLKFFYLEGILAKIPTDSMEENSFFQRIFESPIEDLYCWEGTLESSKNMFRKITKNAKEGT